MATHKILSDLDLSGNQITNFRANSDNIILGSISNGGSTEIMGTDNMNVVVSKLNRDINKLARYNNTVTNQTSYQINLVTKLTELELSRSGTISISTDVSSGVEIQLMLINISNSNIQVTIPSAINDKSVYYNGVIRSGSIEISPNCCEELNILVGKYYYIRSSK